MGFTAEPTSINVIRKSTMSNRYSLLQVYILAGEKKVMHIKPLHSRAWQNQKYVVRQVLIIK